MGRAKGVRYDRELLYVACILHDLGLCDDAAVQTRFEVEGADAAVEFLADRGVTPERREIVWDAIALHTTAVIPQRKAPEVALCQLGIAIDVGVVPSSVLPPGVAQAAIQAQSRSTLAKELPACLCRLWARNREAAVLSHAVSDAAERLVPGFVRPNLCDFLSGADFEPPSPARRAGSDSGHQG